MLLFLVICLFLAVRTICFNIANITNYVMINITQADVIVSMLSAPKPHISTHTEREKNSQSPCRIIHARLHLYFLTAFECIIFFTHMLG